MPKQKNNESNSIESLDKIIDNTFAKIKDIVDGNTTIGSVIKLTDKIFVIPISKVSVGLISGGGEFPNAKKKKGLSAGSSTGFAVTPMGFVVINESSVDYISSTQVENSTNKLFDTLVNLSEKLINTQGEKNEEN